MGEEVQQVKNDAPVKVDEGPKRFVEKGRIWCLTQKQMFSG